MTEEEQQAPTFNEDVITTTEMLEDQVQMMNLEELKYVQVIVARRIKALEEVQDDKNNSAEVKRLQEQSTLYYKYEKKLREAKQQKNYSVEIGEKISAEYEEEKRKIDEKDFDEIVKEAKQANKTKKTKKPKKVARNEK